jgi:hypothetical protein
MCEARLDGWPVALTIIRISSCIASRSVPISFMAEARKISGMESRKVQRKQS